MNAIWLALSLLFAVCGAGIVLGQIRPQMSIPVLLGWAGSVSAAMALWASATVLIAGVAFSHSLWTIPPCGPLTVSLDRVSAFFLGKRVFQTVLR